jgi:hypothetical protein
MHIQLPEPLRKRLASEFRFAADGMAANPDLVSKLYFFSVFFGETNRALNQSWSPELALMHLVLQKVHGQLNERANIPITVPEIPSELPGALDKLANELAELFGRKQVDEGALTHILAKAAELGYVVSGNGFYLYIKGDIKIETDAPTALPPPSAQSPTGASSKASRRVKRRP